MKENRALIQNQHKNALFKLLQSIQNPNIIYKRDQTTTFLMKDHDVFFISHNNNLVWEIEYVSSNPEQHLYMNEFIINSFFNEPGFDINNDLLKFLI